MNTLTHSHLINIFLILIISTVHSYSPPDSISIDCGSSSPLSHDGLNRPWLPDTQNPQFTLLHSNKSLTYTAQKQPTDKDKIPYFTARLSLSPFTYLFSLSSKNPVFIRLHFYPNTYQSFDPSKDALFSVKADDFTLLSNFSPSLFTNYLNEESFMREYCIYPQAKTLNLTFIPSPDSFAFINGIEIVSFPEDLYYGSGGDLGFHFIGNEANPYQLSNQTGLEPVYRFNVGGAFISTVEDTGMFREWMVDDLYYNVIGAMPQNLSIDLKYDNFPNYTAPDVVYQTARTMGNGIDGTQNEGYNLTWNLPVDSGFTYWVRLHFCEFQSEIQNEGDREFIIYLYNRTAEEQADVIRWSGGNGVPVYRDYVVIISTENKKQNLSISLHPCPKQYTRYSDAILNGIEVFKLSNNDGSLAALNHDPLVMSPSDPKSPPPKRKSGKLGLIAGVSLGSVLVISLVLGFLFFRRHKGKRAKGMVSYISVKSGSSGGSSSLPADLCPKFSIMEIRAATRDFDKVFVIGRGGFGDVYKGHIESLDSAVAIKRLNPGSKQGAVEFMTEIEMLSQLRHVHLVPLIGYCNDEREMILVYEYMSRGTLRDHLYKTENPPLSWNQRLQICIGAAKGLHYLHAGAKRMIIHRDVKTTNILLDDKFVAKVSDFGLSKMNPDNTTDTHISTAVKGSFGYLDPEYYRRQQLTEKSDVYSFGVVLFEVLCARPPLDKSLERPQISLASWARKCYDNGTISRIIDPYLAGRIAAESLKKFVEVAISCLDDEGIKRPSMNDLVWNLEFALQLQDSAAMGGERIGDGSNDLEDEKASESSSTWNITSSKNSTSFTASGSSEDKMSSGAVFSEIMNPMAR